MRSHVLYYARFAALNSGDTVLVILGAGVDVHSLVDGGFQICLGCLPGEVGAGNFDLQAGLIWSRCHDVEILRVHSVFA